MKTNSERCLLSIALLFLCALALIFNGCAFYDLKKEIEMSDKTFGLAGKVATPSSRKEPVLVLLYSEKKEIIAYTLTQDTGHFSFLAPAGTYYLAAFEDLNNNLSQDSGEPAGFFGRPDRIVMPSSADSGSRLHLDIRLTEENLSARKFETAIDVQKHKAGALAKFGQITTLDDQIFNQENGSTGYWKPMTFLRDFGVGIYFIEPYSPDKIPILFVHGANGTPVGWKPIIAQLDRTRYQPWFYYYPSGFRLGDISRALSNILIRLHDTYQFNTLYITAHSMGGLVSRSFIMKNVFESQKSFVKLFISISTPWNGHGAAAKGAKQAPVAIPSWHDMTPDSEFIRGIYKRPLPAGVRFYLFFSFRGNCSLFMNNNDGTVELSSELDYRAQADAARIFGFDEDHDSILTSQRVIKKYVRILESVR
jgi:uncharacterized alpha/beta hydrolase family protein